jgi:UDP-N-acetyl-D-mannosaminuronate dehydrogenase
MLINVVLGAEDSSRTTRYEALYGTGIANGLLPMKSARHLTNYKISTNIFRSVGCNFLEENTS